MIVQKTDIYQTYSYK